MINLSKKRGNFTRLPNALLLDDTISDEARGLLVRLLLTPDDRNFNIDDLLNTKNERHHDIRSAIRELENKKYIHRFILRENGRITGTQYFIYDRVTSRVDALETFEKRHLSGGGK